MNWRFAVEDKYVGTKNMVTLKRLSDTKITRHVKTQCEANPFDPEWEEYFEKRETHKMLISLKGRESLLSLWKKQKRVCPICGEPIDRVKTWSVTKKLDNERIVKFLVHDSCRRRSIYPKNREDFEPVS